MAITAEERYRLAVERIRVAKARDAFYVLNVKAWRKAHQGAPPGSDVMKRWVRQAKERWPLEGE